MFFSAGKRNSLAAEFSGRSSTVWEWDSRDIDRFCIALETERILPKFKYEIHNYSSYEPVKISLPLIKKEITLPQEIKFHLFGKEMKIPLISKKKEMWGGWDVWSLRKQFGGDYIHIAFDIIGQFLPLVLLFLLWKYISGAMTEAEGKKK